MNVGGVHTVVLSLAGPTPQEFKTYRAKSTSTLTPALLVVIGEQRRPELAGG